MSGAVIAMIMRIVVVLPAPFGPSSPNIDPRGTCRERSSTAWKRPNAFDTWDSSIAFSIAARIITDSLGRGLGLGQNPQDADAASPREPVARDAAAPRGGPAGGRPRRGRRGAAGGAGATSSRCVDSAGTVAGRRAPGRRASLRVRELGVAGAPPRRGRAVPVRSPGRRRERVRGGRLRASRVPRLRELASRLARGGAARPRGEPGADAREHLVRGRRRRRGRGERDARPRPRSRERARRTARLGAAAVRVLLQARRGATFPAPRRSRPRAFSSPPAPTRTPDFSGAATCRRSRP